MIAGHTKFEPDRLFAKIAKTYIKSDVYTTKDLAALASNYADVVTDDGEVVCTWREAVGEKYTKLPGIRSLHDFLITRHPQNGNAIMKVREQCLTNSFEDTPMRITQGYSATENVCPCP